MRLIPIVVSLAVLLGHEAHACRAPLSPQVFAIEHQTFGEIGRQELRFGCSGDRLTVDIKEEIEVSIALITAFERTAAYRQVWEGDKLQSFHGQILENEDQLSVRAERHNDTIAIEGQDGLIEVPDTAVPDLPWREGIATRPLAFDTGTGELIFLSARSEGLEDVSVGDVLVPARKIAVIGDRVRELWYDEIGLLKWRLRTHGATITLTRQDDTQR